MRNIYLKKTIALITVGIACAFSTAHAQSQNWQWAQKSGGSLNDISNGVAVDAIGNTYVTGNYASTSITFGSTTLTNSGGLDFYLVKYDPSGNVLWAKGATGVSNDGGYNVTVDASGNAYVIGTYNSSHLTFGTTMLTLNGYDDVFIVKYDASGNVLWAKTAGGSGNDIGENISIDASGNSYITGYFASPTIAFGSTTLTNVGGNDFFAAKYDASGNVLWAKMAGGSANELGLGIASDATGNTYVTGNYASTSITFGSTTLTNSGGLDFYLVKYDASGNVVWAKGATGVSNDGGYNVKVDASGNAYVVGTYNSSHVTFGTTMLTLNSYDDLFIVKFDASGNVLWAKTAGGTGNDIGGSIAIDNNGTSYITGYFASTTLPFGSTTLTNTGINNIFVAAYDASGTVLWAKSAGGTSDDRGISIAVDANGNNSYITGNFSSSTVSFNTTTLTNAGGNDMYLAKLGNTTVGIKESLNNQQAAFTIAPNPNNGLFELLLMNGLSTTVNDQISITNMLGQTVYETHQLEQVMNLHIETAGVYFVTLKIGSDITTKKIIVK